MKRNRWPTFDLAETVWGLDEHGDCDPEISGNGFLSKGVDSTMLVVE
jgi:hypothetical protein